MSDKNSNTNKDNKNNDAKEEEIDTNTTKQKKQKKELSDEDKEYKKNIDTMVEGLFLDDYDLRMNSYNMLKKEITTSTSSMTSIPKPLKFLKEHFEEIKNVIYTGNNFKFKIFEKILFDYFPKNICESIFDEELTF